MIKLFLKVIKSLLIFLIYKVQKNTNNYYFEINVNDMEELISQNDIISFDIICFDIINIYIAFQEVL